MRKLVGTRLAGDDHVLEELACATAGAAVDVAAVPSLDREPRAVEDLRIELAAVVDHDHDARAAAAATPRAFAKTAAIPST